MANTVLTPDIIAKEAVMILENNCVAGQLMYRGYENEYDSVNGYKPGQTIRIKRPTDFTVRDGATASIQDAVEGSLNFTVNSFKGVDFQFSSQELTQNIGDLSERVIKPAMVQVANQIDRDAMALYKDVWNWVGIPGTNVTTFAGFAKAPERMDLSAVPQDDRSAILSPTDQWGMLGSQTALYMQDVAKDAYRKGKLGQIASVDTYSSQNVQTHTTGTRTNVPILFNGTTTTTWAATKTSGTMSVVLDGFGTSTTVVAGDVFTIASVYAVNPVTKATLGFLQPFVIKSDATASVAGTCTITISPPIITTGAFQTVALAPVDNATCTFFGTASTGYASNLVFHKNAFAMACVPLEKPPGAVDVARRSYKGYSVRVIPYYTGSNDISSWRLDVLYGLKTIDPRLAVRLSGT